MKIKSIYNLILSSIAVTAFSACSDDLGNYSYEPVNEVSVGGSESDDVPELISGKTYDVVAHVDHIRFSPKIVSTFGITDDARYEYEWRVVPPSAETEDVDYDKVVISTQRCIDIPVTLDAAKYNCFFNVKDKESGVTWSTPFYLQVRSLNGEGWFVLCDDHGRARIDNIFNKTADEDIVARDVFPTEEFDPGKPLNLIFSYRNRSEDVLLVTDKDTYILDPADLHAGEDNRLAWNFGAVPASMKVKASVKSQYAGRDLWTIIDENDEIYTLDLSTDGGVFEFPVTKIDGKTAFKPAPFIGVNVNNNSYSEDMSGCIPTVLYDETHSQFLMISNTSNYPEVMDFKTPHLFENPTGGLTMLCMENTHSGVIKSILRNPSNGETYYYGISLHAEVIWAENWWEEDEYRPYNKQVGYTRIIGPGVDRADKFTFHGMWQYVFYSVDNKVYQFNLSEPEVPAQEVLSFPGEDIVEMKLYPFIAWVQYQDWERAREYDLVVATNNPSLDDSNCGTVRFYEVPNLMKPLKLKKETNDFTAS